MGVEIRTTKSAQEAFRALQSALPYFARDVQNATIVAFNNGTNAKGQPLHIPKRQPGTKSGLGKGLKSLKTLRSLEGGFGIGGAGVDTGTLLGHLASRDWHRVAGDFVSIQPMINMSESRPDGTALVEYYEDYRDKYAHGSITGLNAQAIASIERTIRSVL